MSVLLHFNKLLTKPNQKQIRYAQNDRLRLSFDGTIREHYLIHHRIDSFDSIPQRYPQR